LFGHVENADVRCATEVAFRSEHERGPLIPRGAARPERCPSESRGETQGTKATVRAQAAEVSALKADGVRPVEIARGLGSSRASVYRVLAA